MRSYQEDRALAHATRAVNVRRRPQVSSFQRLEIPGEKRGMPLVLAFLVALVMVFFGAVQR
jgi:hypothetical protein